MTEIKNPEVFRANICDKLETVVGEKTLAINIEKGVFNYAIKESTSRKIIKKWENAYFAQLYIDRLRTIYLNLKKEAFLKLIKDKEITPQQLAHMTHQEMDPSHWKEHIEKKIKRDMALASSKIEASTDLFTCRKCKSTRCTYYELQTRSADEPMTIFVTCLDCGKHFKC